MTSVAAAPHRATVPNLKSETRPRVCFVMPNMYGALSGREDLSGFGGGAERQMTIVAKELADRGYDVSVVAMDHGQREAITHDGLRVHRAFGPDEGLPGLRFVHPRMTKLWSAMTRANADVYVQRCGDSVTGVAAAWCRVHGRAFVFSAASDADCKIDLPNLRTIRERSLFRFGLKNATRVIVQTVQQQEMLRGVFAIDSARIASCAPSLANGSFKPNKWSERAKPLFLWVGRFTRNKRLESFLELARSFPAFDFAVAGSAYVENEYSLELTARAGHLPNVEMCGQVERRGLAELYESATALVCTSGYEGFPNTFLEAWSFGVPVITTVDPDNVVRTNRLGFVASDATALWDSCRQFGESKTLRSEYSRRAAVFFQAHHTVRAVVDEYEAMLEGLPWQTVRAK